MAHAVNSVWKQLRFKLAFVIAIKLVALVLLYQFAVKPQLKHIDARQFEQHLIETNHDTSLRQ